MPKKDLKIHKGVQPDGTGKELKEEASLRQKICQQSQRNLKAGALRTVTQL